MPNFYIDVAVAAPGAKKQAVFTYLTDTELQPGQIVAVPFRGKKTFAVALTKVKKPSFKVQAVSEAYISILPSHSLETLIWAMGFYPFDKGAVVKLFTPPDFPKLRSKPLDISTAGPTEKKPPTATKEQSAALRTITGSSPFTVLHGKTGSGKTLVYSELIRQCIGNNQSVVILVPEISLSQQLKASLEEYVKPIYTYHSLATAAERRKLWESISVSDQPHVIAGPRSALFLPLKNLGAIIIDEAHDTSFKHQQAPYYTTLHMAAVMAKAAGAKLIYGSATPGVADFYSAIQKDHSVASMTERPVASRTKHSAEFSLISTRERQNFVKSSVLSDTVVEAVKASLKKGTQSLLLLNRRGTAQLIQCEDCGWQYRCDICNHTLVYHKDIYSAVCHFCNKNYTMPTSCPQDSGSLRLLSIGTKFLVEECEKLFPEANVLRIDTDSVTRKSIDEVLAKARSGEAHIIVGTQLIAKGLDLPYLENVVVVDASRKSSDFLGVEHYYQLLHQVIGRGRRGHQATKILLQTPELEDPLISWAVKDDWQAFYDHELKERRQYNYPPFAYLAVFSSLTKSPRGAEKAADDLRSKCISKNIKADILGPIPALKGTANEWRIVVKARRRSTLIECAGLMPSGWSIDLDPIST